MRQKLEYCIQAWNPSLIKDIELLEQVQHRATKLIPEISHLPYHDRLKYLNLTTLELRRHRGDLIVLFVCFVALRPKSTAKVIAGRSVHLTTLFPGQA